MTLDERAMAPSSLQRAARAVRDGVRTLFLRRREPVIICPYVYDSDVERVSRAFHLDSPAGRRLPFFFWKDAHLIGPERAYEHCWDRFPERDIVIIHTDMSPMPCDTENGWYEALLSYVQDLPQAGIVGCDLLYPWQSTAGDWLIQSAGGYFKDGKELSVGGGVDVARGRIGERARLYTPAFDCIREVEWVTFGGVYIRRQVINQCGGFDRRYRWAYAMDVDYSLEARRRGFRLFQVPVTLLHEESRTTRRFLARAEYSSLVRANRAAFSAKWMGPDAGAMVRPEMERTGPLFALSTLPARPMRR